MVVGCTLWRSLIVICVVLYEMRDAYLALHYADVLSLSLEWRLFVAGPFVVLAKAARMTKGHCTAPPLPLALEDNFFKPEI